MRYLGMAVLMIFAGAGLAQAVTVDLKDGSQIAGSVIKQDDKSLQIDVDGVTMTYYADEIKDVDGQPFTAGTTASATPAAQPPVVTPAAPSSIPVAVPESSSPTEIDPDKKALILKFIDVFGTRQALNSNFERMIDQVAQTKPEEAQKIRDRVKIDELIDRLVPIYDQNFTSDDLKSFIAFYGSPQGQKLLAASPQLMKESVQISIKYIEDKFPELKSGQ